MADIPKIQDAAYTTLSINAVRGATTLSVADASVFPTLDSNNANDSFDCYIFSADNVDDLRADTKFEAVKVSSVTGNVLTLKQGLKTAKASNSYVVNTISASAWDAMRSAVDMNETVAVAGQRAAAAAQSTADTAETKADTAQSTANTKLGTAAEVKSALESAAPADKPDIDDATSGNLPANRVDGTFTCLLYTSPSPRD